MQGGSGSTGRGGRDRGKKRAVVRDDDESEEESCSTGASEEEDEVGFEEAVKTRGGGEGLGCLYT